MNYRAEIDGLRAVAVVSVILFHVGFQIFGGGYIGVDVFFVISGFLITNIILKELKEERFSIANFYERRAKRILPALFFYLFLSTVLAIYIFPPHMLKDFGQSLFANSVFLSNIFFYIETDYFNDMSETALLLHTWSLAVEEQYYIVLPLLLLIFNNLHKFRILLILTLSILSIIFSELILLKDPPQSFYLIHTRFWELGIGSLVAFQQLHKPLNFSKTNSDFISLAGLLLVIYPVFYYNSLTPFPGVNALAPVLGTALIIMFGNNGNYLKKFLSNPVFVGIGLISYSWYLSHHIVFAALRASNYELSDLFRKTVAILISLVVAIFTYRFVERPTRRLKIERKFIFLYSLIGLILAGSSGYFLHKTNGLMELKFAQLSEAQKTLVLDYNHEKEAKMAFWKKAMLGESRPFNTNSNKQKILILGDSKSEDLYVAASIKEFPGAEFRRLRLNDDCMASSLAESRCPGELAKVLDSPLLSDATSVVLTNTWQLQTNSGVVDFIKTISGQGKNIILLSTSNFNDAASMSYEIARGSYTDSAISDKLFENIRSDWRRQYFYLKSDIIASDLPIKFIEKLEAFCLLEKKKCNLFDEQGWYIFDSGHLTVHGAHFMHMRMRQLKWFE